MGADARPRGGIDDLSNRAIANRNHLEYEINLNTFDHLITAHTPDEMKNV